MRPFQEEQARVLSSASRWRVRPGTALSSLEAEAGARSYALARSRHREYELAMMEALKRPAAQSGNRRTCLNLARRLYRVQLRSREVERLPRIALAAAHACHRGLCPELALSIVRESCRVLSLPEPARLESTVKRLLRQPESQGKEKPMNESPTEVQSSRPKTARVPRRPARRSDELLKSESALERVRLRNAVSGLRQALALEQPPVRHCVARRLLDHAGYDELAAELGISREQVAGILSSRRPLVTQFTCLFNDDWYWLEDGGFDLKPAVLYERKNHAH